MLDLRRITIAFTVAICIVLSASAAIGKDFFIGSLTEATNTFRARDQQSVYVGSGGTLGFNAYGIDVGGDLLNMGSHRFAFATRVGKRFEFGSRWTTKLGLFTGPRLHLDPNESPAPTTLSQQTRLALKTSGVDATLIEEQLQGSFASEQNTVSKFALGWQVAEMQMTLERKLLRRFTIGVSAHAAYQLLIDGHDIIGFSRFKAVDQVDETLKMSSQDPSIKTQIREDVGAKKLSWNELTRLNYRASLYFTMAL